jgi:hypothetical protein
VNATVAAATVTAHPTPPSAPPPPPPQQQRQKLLQPLPSALICKRTERCSTSAALTDIRCVLMLIHAHSLTTHALACCFLVGGMQRCSRWVCSVDRLDGHRPRRNVLWIVYRRLHGFCVGWLHSVVGGISLHLPLCFVHLRNAPQSGALNTHAHTHTRTHTHTHTHAHITTTTTTTTTTTCDIPPPPPPHARLRSKRAFQHRLSAKTSNLADMLACLPSTCALFRSFATGCCRSSRTTELPQKTARKTQRPLRMATRTALLQHPRAAQALVTTILATLRLQRVPTPRHRSSSSISRQRHCTQPWSESRATSTLPRGTHPVQQQQQQVEVVVVLAVRAFSTTTTMTKTHLLHPAGCLGNSRRLSTRKHFVRF